MRFMTFALTGVLLAIPFLASAQTRTGSADRAGQWETTLGVYGTKSENADGTNGSGADIDGTLGLTFSVGYNFSDHLALRFDGSWLAPDYTATLATEERGLVEIDNELDVFSGQFNGVYHLMDGPFTPYVQAGLGWTYIDSNIVDGLPSTGCWWDPWWGYICANFYSTYSTTNFSWNVGLGLRYEFRSDMFIRGGWEQTRIDSDGTNPSFDALRLEIGWQF